MRRFSEKFFLPQVDKHIRRLDSDLAKFEAEIKEKALNNNKKEEDTSSKKSEFLSVCLVVVMIIIIIYYYFLF